MNLGLCIIIAVALAVIVGIISHLVTVSNLKKNAESKIGNAETRAREIIDDAVKTAETTKKEALLEVKEESIRTKNDLEKETKEIAAKCDAAVQSKVREGVGAVTDERAVNKRRKLAVSPEKRSSG